MAAHDRTECKFDLRPQTHDRLGADLITAPQGEAVHRRHAGIQPDHLAAHEGESVHHLGVPGHDGGRGNTRGARNGLGPPGSPGQIRDENGQVVDVPGLETALLPLVELLDVELPRLVGVLEHAEHRVAFGVTHTHLHPWRLLRQIVRHAAKSTTYRGTRTRLGPEAAKKNGPQLDIMPCQGPFPAVSRPRESNP